MDCEDLYINSVSRILWPVILLSFILKSEEQIKGEQTKAAMNFELIWMWSWLATIQRAQNPSLNTLKFSTGSSWIWVSWFTCIFTCIHVRDKSSFKLSPSQKHRAASPLCNPAELRDDTGCPSSWTPGFSPSAKSLLLTDNCLPSSSERTTSSMTRFTGTTTSKKKKKSIHSEVNMRVYCSQATPFGAHSFLDICSSMLKPWAPLARGVNSEICSTCSRGAIFKKEALSREKQQFNLCPMWDKWIWSYILYKT